MELLILNYAVSTRFKYMLFYHLRSFYYLENWWFWQILICWPNNCLFFLFHFFKKWNKWGKEKKNNCHNHLNSFCVAFYAAIFFCENEVIYKTWKFPIFLGAEKDKKNYWSSLSLLCSGRQKRKFSQIGEIKKIIIFLALLCLNETL